MESFHIKVMVIFSLKSAFAQDGTISWYDDLGSSIKDVGNGEGRGGVKNLNF